MDLITGLFDYLLAQALERQFAYPLHITLKAADGQEMEWLLPAPDETPLLLSERLHPGEPPLRSPYDFTVSEWDVTRSTAKRTFRAQLELKPESDSFENGDVESGDVSVRRSNEDLITELDGEADRHWAVALVVGYENTTVMVMASDPDRLKLLSDATGVGGIAVGLIAADKEDGHLKIMQRVFPEHPDEDGTYHRYLSGLSEEMARRVREMHGERE